MPDISTIWDVNNSRGDWQIQGAGLLSGNDLDTAVLISLFTDRTAEPSDVIPDGTTNPRGWWGDLGEDYPIGSRLWLLDRSKETNQVLQAAQNYITEALQWMLDDGVVANFDIVTEWTRPGMLGAQIAAYQQDGTKVALKYSWAWSGLN
jgi:phage gp46-like protein